ncbi:hypothetical protein BU204_20150 [Actinophytocola xanthii]|uniref:Polysaccharide biosynthesis protein n=1 Tax=Actinophytocola xanthii TaxID=1912961 RepID=A0A1Q8CN73_9PSEU|nr:hypothetical protein BU204_20150 [Actinophytocola xanthii]
MIDLTRLWVGVRRRRRMWVALALLGMIAGGLFSTLLPSPAEAVTRILVLHEEDQPSDGGSLIRTDATLVMTTRVAAAALDALGSDQRPEQFITQYTAVGLTNNVLELTVKGPTPAEAVRRADALAQAFIADHVGRIQTSADAQAKALLAQRDKINTELKDVNGQIARAEGEARAAQEQAELNGETTDSGQQVQPNAANLDSLYARRAELTSRISDLSQQAQEAGIGAPRVAAGTQVVDKGRAIRRSVLASTGAAAGIGLVLGLVSGVTLAAVMGVVRDRPVLRRDIAAHLAASVVAQLPAPRRGPARLWRRSRAAQERDRVAATLVRLVRDGSGPVSVLELGAPRVAAALALDVATRLDDRPVALVEDPAGRLTRDDLSGRDLAELTGREKHPVRVVGAEDTGPARPGEVRIGVGSVTPGTAWTDLPHLGQETLLVVRAGFANAAWLHTVARQLADASIPVVGVVLVDPDPKDSTDGTLWDGLHTALRGRAARAETVPRLEPGTVNGSARTTSVNGSTNGATNGSADGPELPTHRFSPVGQDRAPEQSVHDVPTRRFPPVRAEDVEGLNQRRTKG